MGVPLLVTTSPTYLVTSQTDLVHRLRRFFKSACRLIFWAITTYLLSLLANQTSQHNCLYSIESKPIAGYAALRLQARWGKGVFLNIIDIWSRVTEGDTVAWEELVQHYARLVFSAALQSGLSPSEAEDCSQQTWLALYRHRYKINRPEQLPAWLMNTTRRRAWRMIKRRERTREAYQQLDPPDRHETPDDLLMKLQNRANLELALNRLGGRCETLLRAIFFSPDELSYKEIAQKLGIPPNSLGPTRSRCLAKLKKILNEIEQA